MATLEAKVLNNHMKLEGTGNVYRRPLLKMKKNTDKIKPFTIKTIFIPYIEPLSFVAAVNDTH